MSALRECRAFDLFMLGTQRVKDADGFLHVPGCIAKAGNIQEYRAGELELDGDPNRVVRLYRPRDEVAKSTATFARKPITNEHPPGRWITPDNWERYAVGDAGSSVDMQGDDMMTELIFRKKSAIADLEAGKVALSNGYKFHFDDSKKATPEGAAVDGWMTNIQGNHIALVDRGRGGPGCVVADKETHMMRTVKIGKLSFEVDATAADAVELEQEKSAKDVAAAMKLAEDAEKRAVASDARAKKLLDGECPDCKGEVEVDGKKCKMCGGTGEMPMPKKAGDRAAAELKAAKDAIPTAAQIEALAAERASVVCDAAVLAPDLKPEGKTVDQIRREALTACVAKDAGIKAVADAAMAGAPIDKAAPEVVKATFSAAASIAKSNKTANDKDSIAADLLSAGSGQGSGKDKTTADADGLVGYALFCDRINHPKAQA